MTMRYEGNGMYKLDFDSGLELFIQASEIQEIINWAVKDIKDSRESDFNIPENDKLLADNTILVEENERLVSILDDAKDLIDEY